MSKVNIVLILSLAICVLVASAAPALAAPEFVKVGGKITTKSEATAFLAPNASVRCGSSSGSGTVASATLLKLEVEYSSCKGIFGEGKAVEVKVSPCKLSLTLEGVVTLEGGCKAESSTCTLEPSTTENKLSEAVEYYNINTEEKSRETEIELDAAGVKYKANAACELVGVKSGSEGTLDEASVAQNVNVQPNAPKFWIKTGGTSRTIKQKNVASTEYEFIFPPGSKFIKCREASNAGDSTVFVETPFVDVGSLSFGMCRTNMFESEPSVTMTANCSSTLALGARAAGESVPGAILWSDPCTIEGKVSLCVVEFTMTRLPALGSKFKNTAGSNPKTVTVKQSGAGGPDTTLPYTANSGCTGVTEREGSAIYRGESIVSAETNTGGAADIEIKTT